MVLTSAAELLHGFAHDELLLRYQPVFDTETKSAKRVEAIIHWRHPTQGLLTASDFTADMANGLGRALLKDTVTRFMLSESIGQVAAWRRAGCDIPMSVNVAPWALANGWVSDFVDELLWREHVAPDQLTIEITGQACPLDSSAVTAAVHALAALGVRVSLDNFGTGTATLTRLHTLPFDEIKVDPTFVNHVSTRSTDRSIIVFAARLTDSLGIDVIADGVASEVTRTELRRLGLRLMQGDHLHPPCAPEDVTVLFPSALRDHGHVVDLTDHDHVTLTTNGNR